MSETATATPASPTAAAAPAQQAGISLAGTPTQPAPAQSTPILGQSTPIFGGHVNESGAFREGWTESIRAAGFETLAGKLQTAKDEKGALSILDNAIKTASRRELKGHPNEGWADHEVAEFRRAYGIPEEAQGYKLKPENLPDGVAWDDAQASEFAALAHKLHIPEATAKALVEFQLGATAKALEEAKGALSQEIEKFTQESMVKFKQEWGPDFDQRLQANKDFVNARFTPEELADPAIQKALSHPKIVEVFDLARLSFRGAQLPGAQNTAQIGSESPQQQAERIMAENPRWQQDAALSKRVLELHALQAQQNKRR